MPRAERSTQPWTALILSVPSEEVRGVSQPSLLPCGCALVDLISGFSISETFST